MLAAESFAHYNLIRVVGRGGMSTVYEAEDRRMGRRVAVKVLAPPFGSTHDDVNALRSRMMREARAIAALSHPNIVTIYDVGTENDQDYLVMEYLKGETLRERMKGAPFSLTEVSGVLSQVAAALDTVHAAGIVHRDLKPSNIMILPSGQVKLMDFGVARHQDDTMVTQVGMIVGTPTFMAPEQVRGELGTGASDIWALGILTYQMIAGRLPFPGKQIPAILHQVAYDDPPPIEELSPRAQSVIDRALQKDPGARYATATEMASAFAAAIAPETPAVSAAIAPETPAVAEPIVPLPEETATIAAPTWDIAGDQPGPSVPPVNPDGKTQDTIPASLNPRAPRIPRPLPEPPARRRHGAQALALLVLATCAFAGVYAMTAQRNRPVAPMSAQHTHGQNATVAKRAWTEPKAVSTASVTSSGDRTASHKRTHRALLLHRRSAQAIPEAASHHPTQAHARWEAAQSRPVREAAGIATRDRSDEADTHAKATPAAARRIPKAQTVTSPEEHTIPRSDTDSAPSVPDSSVNSSDTPQGDDQGDSTSGSDSDDGPHHKSPVSGVWRGRIWHNPATLTVYPHSGRKFTGSLSVHTPEGRVRVAVTGQVSKSGDVTIHENQVTSAERPHSWDLGDYTGHLGDGSMQGSGHDVRGRSYPWSMSR
jgi:serine/threonine-protein kinase